MRQREHGGDVFYASGMTGIPAGGIIDFSASINPLGPPPGALAAARGALRLVHHYPEPGAERLASEVARKLGESIGEASDIKKMDIARRIIPGNGSTELIYLLPRALKPETVLIHGPTFSEYARAARLSGARVLAASGQNKKLSFDFALTPENFARGMRGAQMAFLCNPNNPTGEVLERDTVLDLAREAKKARCLLIIDEAFIDFCPGQSVTGEAARGENRYLAVLRSMTKFYALTGLRVGYAVLGSSRMAARVRRFKEPWSVNLPAVEAALHALKDPVHAQKSLRFMEKERAYVARRLEKAGIWRFRPPSPSASLLPLPVGEGRGEGRKERAQEIGPNFFLVKLPGAHRFVEAQFKKGVLVRDCSNFKGIDRYEGGLCPDGEEGFIRVAVRTRRENEMLLGEMEKWMRREGRLNCPQTE